MKNSQNYTLFFENISQDTPMDEYEKVFCKNARFKDPFNDVIGVDKIYEIFQDMYKKLDNPRFEVTEVIEDKNVAYLRWIFEYNFKNDPIKNSFEGVSRVAFNEENLAISHIDYWDAGQNVYEKIPILSYFIKLVKRKIKS